VASNFPQSEEEAISKAQQYDLIYSQSEYLYTVLPDLPKPVPFDQDKPRMSHSVDGLIGNTMHHAPCTTTPTTTNVWHTSISAGIWGNLLLLSTPLSKTIPCFSPSTHQWATVGTPNTPTYLDKFGYFLYLSLYSKY
jgi:hypothetical protein